MRWFRRNRCFGAQAALLALLVQFAVAFGHFHATDNDHDTGAAIAVVTTDNSNSPAPHDDGANHPAKGACTICATIHLSSTAQAASVPVLLVPITYSVSELSFVSELATDDPRCFEQRSRGPPQA